MNNAGRWRKKRLRPAHHHAVMRTALDKLGVQYKDYVLYYNKYDQIQSIDFLVRTRGGKFAAILWDYTKRKRYKDRYSGLKPYEKENWRRKKEHLEEKGIPYIAVDRYHSSDEFRVIVNRLLRTLDK